MALAAPGETTCLLHPKVPLQAKETKCEILVKGGQQQQNNALGLPLPV
jgi:hypothetical protein